MSPPKSNSFMVLPMRLLRLFRAGRDILPSGQAAQDQAERILAEAFRTLGGLCARMADVLEAQRLARGGYGAQGKFLERLDRPGSPPRPS
jgi:hypothetical protein